MEVKEEEVKEEEVKEVRGGECISGIQWRGAMMKARLRCTPYFNP